MPEGIPMNRAVIYARCSTEEDNQVDALQKQETEARECVTAHGWILTDVYVESRSGTSRKGRSEYNRLYEDLAFDAFDIIVIKSQDRLMRNTRDWYLFTDRLSSYKKKLYFYLEQKFYSTDDGLLTGIKAILAEEYSRDLSRKMNNAHHNRQKKGSNIILTSLVYGFRRLPNGNIILDEEEAAVKRRMYELCAQGYGGRRMANLLQKEGILTRSGHPFTAQGILRIIRNPLNKGTAVMNRSHYDFITGQTTHNPCEAWYIHKGMVPATVSDKLWETANQAIDSRCHSTGTSRRGKNTGKSPLSGKLVCGLCACPYYRTSRKKYRSQTMIHEWRCREYIEHGRQSAPDFAAGCANTSVPHICGCNNTHLRELDFIKLLLTYLPGSRSSGDDIICELLSMLRAVLTRRTNSRNDDLVQQELTRVETHIDLLTDKLLEGIISDELYRKKLSALTCRRQQLSSHTSVAVPSASDMEERITYIEQEIRLRHLDAYATLSALLENVQVIYVYPTYVEIQFHNEEACQLPLQNVPTPLQT